MYLFPHNNDWQSEFQNEKNSIVYSYGAAIEIFHIGSTAIKGLYPNDKESYQNAKVFFYNRINNEL